MDDSVDDAFFSKMLSEDFSDSGVITAFESFISQLKKLFSVTWTLLMCVLCVAFSHSMQNYLFITRAVGENYPIYILHPRAGFWLQWLLAWSS